jgi:soluble lytic murein transglycosylase-like protein
MLTIELRVALAVASIGVLRAQAPVTVPPAAPAAVSKPGAAAAAMERSVARQRSSVTKQGGGKAETGSFFVLAPPERMGATVAAIAPAPAADCEPLPASEVDALVQKAAKSQDLDEQVLRGVIQQESAFRPCAVSPKGAMGMMQLMPATASQFGVQNPFDPADNIQAGATFLKQLLVRYGGDLPQALGAYNAGPAKADAAGGVPKIPETQDYVNRVLSTVPVKK